MTATRSPDHRPLLELLRAEALVADRPGAGVPASTLALRERAARAYGLEASSLIVKRSEHGWAIELPPIVLTPIGRARGMTRGSIDA